jgi:curli biogenesis system outer membrane secretion channel CsgG
LYYLDIVLFRCREFFSKDVRVLMARYFQRSLVLLTVLLTCSTPFVSAQELGKGKGKVSGSAGPEGSKGETAAVEKCTTPKGTIAVNEPQDAATTQLRNLGLTSPLPLLRLIIQQSNCFQIVERGRAMQNIIQERELAESGLLQGGSNMGKGQLVTADFVLTPDVVYSSDNTGGMGGAIGGLFGPLGAAIGGGFKTKAAQTSLLLADARSGLQVASATGAAQKKDFAIGGGGFGGGVGGTLGGYQNTPQGRIIAASLLDNWNEIVRAVRSTDSLIAPTSESGQRNAAASLTATPFSSGDVLAPKIAGVKLLSAPKEGAPALAALAKGEEVVYDGAEQDGFLKVISPKGTGWVKRVLVQKMS